METFSLDTNCIIDVADDRPGKQAVLNLVNCHRLGMADVALIAVSASERQKSGGFLASYADFLRRVRELGLQGLSHIAGIGHLDIGFFDFCLLADETMLSREKELHDTLFPQIAFLSSDYLAAFEPKGLDAVQKAERKWRNAWCDRQMTWAH
ncbi:hypothetical protein [Primorskyibacter sp. 2E233]|uniref:hypothetical protein n=1 Tax=Primorskyibacter sp. 2E233 TaxID=3413431 RepID=UPI003BF2C187